MTNRADPENVTKAEEELQNGEQRYRSLFENMLNGFALRHSTGIL
jgi:PAS domain-containing protein